MYRHHGISEIDRKNLAQNEKRMAHTPGPWRYQEESDAYTHIVRGPENRFITQLGQDTSGVAEANARLIAAAPDMLTTLKSIAETLDKMAPCPEEILDQLLAEAQSAIKAAEHR